MPQGKIEPVKPSSFKDEEEKPQEEANLQEENEEPTQMGNEPLDDQ